MENFHFLNLFNYLTFRAGGALFTAFFISLIWGHKIINKLKNLQKNGQPIRKDGPKSHLINKVGTPTMGGFIILFGLLLFPCHWESLHYKKVTDLKKDELTLVPEHEGLVV